VIAAYLAEKYENEGASFKLPTPELRANDLLVRRIHDHYITPIQARKSQGSFYKAPTNMRSVWHNIFMIIFNMKFFLGSLSKMIVRYI